MNYGPGAYSSLFIFLCFGIALWTNPCNGQIADRYKLSGNSRPVHYNLDMKIDVDEQVFTGSVEITLDVTKATNVIDLHYKDMVVANVRLLMPNGEEMLKLFQNYAEETEILSLTFPYLSIGTYQLLMDFNSKIRTDLKGLYMSTYFDNGGNKRYIATTFMAPTYARMAFPCYDEPEYKANFTIHISHAEKYFALSNMPAEDTQTDLGNGWLTTHFGESKPTSTYIVAFIVCDFVKIEKLDFPLSIYAQPVVLKDLVYALNHFDRARTALESYLGRSFQYPKLDMIAIDDFLMGAMENWGLITYLSSRILINDATDIKTKIAGSKTMSHEMAHQWFGNEVTHYYWNMVWLKEGLATLFEDLLTDTVHPEWRMWDQFVINTMQVVMQQDCASNVRHMLKTYSTPAEIRAVYDFVTYKKSGSVMRMMMNVLTAPVFQKAMDIYVTQNSFATATYQSLASAWQAAVNESEVNLPDIATVFDHWISVPGFPVVSVTRNYEKEATVTLRQRRFIASHSTFGSEIYLNHIPLNYATQRDPDFANTAPTLWLTDREATIELSGVENNQWLIFNKQATGYYRVNYDDDNWNMIINQLKESHSTIPPSNRAQLIDDALNLARYGQLDYKIALDLVSYIKYERDFVPLTSAFANLRELERVSRGSNVIWESFFNDLINNLYLEVNLAYIPTSEPDVDRLLRVEVTSFACKFAHPACTSAAHQHLTTDLNGEFPADIRSAVYCGAVQYFESSIQSPSQVLFERHLNQSTTEGLRRRNDKEINEIFSALSCISDESILRQVLNWTISGRQGVYFDKGDPNKIFAAVASANVTGTMVALEFLDTNYAEVKSKYESMPKIFEALAPNVVTVEMQEIFNKVVQTHITEPMEDTLKTAVDAATTLIAENLKWNELRVESVKEYLNGGATALLLSPFALLVTVLSLGKTFGC